MKTVLFNLLILLVLLSAVGCGKPAEAARSEKERATAPVVDQADLAELVEEDSAFAFDLYQALRAEDGHPFYSPHSIFVALTMKYAGARGETERQMADTLHFVLSQDRLHPAFNALDLELAERGKGAEGKDDEGFRLNIVNAIWGQEGYSFLAEFLDVLAEDYGAGLRLLEFAKAPVGVRVDRPFVFLIRDTESSAVPLLGHVVDPVG